MMKMAAPSIPPGDHCSDDPFPGRRNEQVSVEFLDKFHDVLNVVGEAG